MSDVGLDAILDAIAVHAKASVSGLLAAYATKTSAEDTSTVHLAPTSLDDTPSLFVFMSDGQLEAGNVETLVHQIDGLVYVNAQDAGYAYSTIVPFVQRFRVAFRKDIDANGTATRVLMKGYRRPETTTVNGMKFLVLPIQFEALEIHNSSDYTTSAA